MYILLLYDSEISERISKPLKLTIRMQILKDVILHISKIIKIHNQSNLLSHLCTRSWVFI